MFESSFIFFNITLVSVPFKSSKLYGFAALCGCADILSLPQAKGHGKNYFGTKFLLLSSQKCGT
jgi:hypothetical protein